MTTPNQIIQDCAAAFGVAASDILHPKRGKYPVAVARQAAMTIIRAKCKLHPEEIVLIFKRNISDVYYAAQQTANRADVDVKFRTTFHNLLAGIVTPYRFILHPSARGRAEVPFRQGTRPTARASYRDRANRISLGLDVLSHHVRRGQCVPLSAIAAACDITIEGARQIEQSALKKLRERLRLKLGLELGQFATLTHAQV